MWVRSRHPFASNSPMNSHCTLNEIQTPYNGLLASPFLLPQPSLASLRGCFLLIVRVSVQISPCEAFLVHQWKITSPNVTLRCFTLFYLLLFPRIYHHIKTSHLFPCLFTCLLLWDLSFPLECRLHESRPVCLVWFCIPSTWRSARYRVGAQ